MNTNVLIVPKIGNARKWSTILAAAIIGIEPSKRSVADKDGAIADVEVTRVNTATGSFYVLANPFVAFDTWRTALTGNESRTVVPILPGYEDGSGYPTDAEKLHDIGN